MNYVKIGLEEYDKLKKNHDAFRAKKILKVNYIFPFSHEDQYYTESEVISDLTNRINELEAIIDKLKAEASMEKADVKSNSFWGCIDKIFNK